MKLRRTPHNTLWFRSRKSCFVQDGTIHGYGDPIRTYVGCSPVENIFRPRRAGCSGTCRCSNVVCSKHADCDAARRAVERSVVRGGPVERSPRPRSYAFYCKRKLAVLQTTVTLERCRASRKGRFGVLITYLTHRHARMCTRRRTWGLHEMLSAALLAPFASAASFKLAIAKLAMTARPLARMSSGLSTSVISATTSQI